MKVSFQNTSRESLEAQRRMLKESIADVERLRKSGEVTGDAYLARLKRLRADLAENETAFKTAGLSDQSGNHSNAPTAAARWNSAWTSASIAGRCCYPDLDLPAVELRAQLGMNTKARSRQKQSALSLLLC